MSAILTKAFSHILEAGVTELIGINEQVDQNEYSASVGVTLHPQPVSGEILSFALFTDETGTGAVQTPTGKLILFDADPAIATGDTALAAAEHPTILGIVPVAATDWHADANGATAFIYDVPVPFHALATLYATFFLTSATSLNDGAGDDERLRFNFWYRRDS